MRKIPKLLLMFVLCLVGMQGNAQNVTVKPSTGSMLPAVPQTIEGASGDYDRFFQRGGCATWRHEQLNLTMTASDSRVLTENGQLANPANNLFGRTATDEIEMGRGGSEATRNSYMNFALPKGYRFTGYKIEFSRNKEDFGNPYSGTGSSNTSGTTRFGETDEDFNYLAGYYEDVTYNQNATLGNGSVSITKEDKEGMSNVLYFKLTDANTGTGRMVITFHSITLYFTAEDNYAPALPPTSLTIPVSAVDIPFQTSKVDYGTIKSRTYNDIPRVSYSSASVIDMQANMTLYEAGSVTSGTHFDGTSGNVVKYEEGATKTIRTYKVGNEDWFLLGKSNAKQDYFIESPTYVVLPDENETKNPVGFRIVGATLEYKYLPANVPANTNASVDRFYITYTSGGKTYYLNTGGKFVEGHKTEWYKDANNNVYSGPVYLGFTITESGGIFGTSYSYTLERSYSVPEHPIKVNGTQLMGTHTYNWGWDTNNVYLLGSAGDMATVGTGTNNHASWATETSSANVPGITQGSFKLYVYDKDGTAMTFKQKDGSDAPYILVESSADNSHIDLVNFNNDAVKFGVEGHGLVKASLTMQALDPYIDEMKVVCQDQENGKEGIRLTQPFTASDFSVSGGEFHFFLPQNSENDEVKISFEDLWSHYADETYEGHEAGHNSRFSFVQSAHYNAFTNDNIYDTEASKAEAASATPLERQKVEKVGNKKFKFNNVEDLTNHEGTVTEYPFTQANYEAQDGNFNELEFTVSSATTTPKVAYVFTTDETRYNIAPTSAVQHRAYAFYEMKIYTSTATYTPKVEIVKVYDKTCYDNDAEDAYYGAKVTAPYGTNNQEHGFVSDKAVQKAINRVLTSSPKQDDFGNTDIPANVNKLLYVDMTELGGYYVENDPTTTTTLPQYRNTLAPNAIIFLPEGGLETEDNFAAKDGSLTRASRNIILTDKQPFYTPYDIQVPSQYSAQYTRNSSSDGSTENATVILPFQLTVNSQGKHENPSAADGSFTVNVMQQATLAEDASYEYTSSTAYYKPITEVDDGEEIPNKSEANVPYMIHVVQTPTGAGDNVAFKAVENGALIKASTDMKSRKVKDYSTEGIYQYLYFGESVSDGSVVLKKAGQPDKTINLNIQSEGSYAGHKYDRAHSEAILYFADNKLLNLYRLNSKLRYLYTYPFRAVYAYSGSIQNVSSIFGMDISYDDPFLDGIMDLTRTSGKADLAIRSGKGFVELTASKAQTVTIRSLNGMTYTSVDLGVGDSQTVALPSGIYVVNNTKITVK